MAAKGREDGSHKPLSSMHKRRAKNARWQGPLLSFTVSGAMALALSACNNTYQTPMIVPPNGFDPKQASYFNSTNSPPTNACVYTGDSGNSAYLCSHGYFPVYGYPHYYDRPAPGSQVQLISGGSGISSYSAHSPEEARSTARGGFGSTGGGGGE